MSFLNKLLLIFYLPMLLFTSSLTSDKCNNFIEKINDYYDCYVLETYETSNFTLVLVEGICNDKLSYGVCLSSVEAGEYSLKICINDIQYTIKNDSRKDYLAYVILRTSDKASIQVYDNVNGNSTKRYEYELKYSSKEEFNLCNDFIKGNNLGYNDISKLKKDSSVDLSLLITIFVLSLICLVCLIWVLYLIIFKKGIFNRNINRESEVIFFNFEEEYKDNNLENIEVEYEEEKVDNIEVYEKKYYYEEDIEEFDFKPYLEEKGYKTDYSLMTEEEKNQVMILLMTLKHKEIINEFQYKNEVIKLWKK